MEGQSSFSQRPDVEGDDQIPLREKLSKMSFEELQKLRVQLGSKVFDKAMFGSQQSLANSGPNKHKKRVHIEHYSRSKRNNAPLEISSKKKRKQKPTLTQAAAPGPLGPTSIDPRFGVLYGKFDKAEFEQNYEFLPLIQERELNQLKKNVERVKNPEKKEKMKFIISRMDNQKEAKKILERKKLLEENLHKATIDALENGQRPVYTKKSDIKLLNLVDQYELLKKSNKLEKYLIKQKKKKATLNRKSLEKIGTSGKHSLPD